MAEHKTKISELWMKREENRSNGSRQEERVRDDTEKGYELRR